MLGVFLDKDSADAGDLDLTPLSEAIPKWNWYGHTPPDLLLERLKGSSIAVTNKVHLGADVLSSCKELRLICIAATGTNNVDLETARSLGITVCNVRNYATTSVVQHCFALLLSLTTYLDNYKEAVHTGRWSLSPHFCLLDYPIRELKGKKMGIIGYGTLGQAVADVARFLGMEVLIAQRLTGPPVLERLTLPELLPQVDVLSLHCPLTPATQGLIKSQELESMKPTAILINTARGGIVEETALAEALRKGQIGGAGVDVLSEEPPSSDHPLLALDIPRLSITPHIAWASQEARQRLICEIATNIQAFLAGTPRNVC